ncbi:UNVERIFIED_CONTAM: hypothetical protein FKN15_057747 [Acipenser sinensis]
MVEADILELSNPIHIHCVQYCFLPLIEKQLFSECIEWNSHSIRKQAAATGPFGKPDLLFFCPPSGTENQLCSIDEDLQQHAVTLVCEEGAPVTVANDAFRRLCSSVLTTSAWKDSPSVVEAMAAYLTLTSYIETSQKALNLTEPANFEQACEIYDSIIRYFNTD